MASKRIQGVLIASSEANKEQVWSSVTSEAVLKLFEFQTFVICEEQLKAKFPAGQMQYEFLCLVVSQQERENYVNKFQRIVPNANCVFVHSPSEDVASTSSSAPNTTLTHPVERNGFLIGLFAAALSQERNGPGLFQRLRNVYNRIMLRKGLAGSLMLAVSALITAAGWLKEVRDYAKDYIPHQVSEGAEITLVTATLLLSGIGGLLVAIGIIVEKWNKGGWPWLRWPVATLVVCAVVYFQHELAQKAPSHTDSALSLISDCSNRLWNSAVDATTNGGIYVTKPELGHRPPPVQAWMTAQCLVGLMFDTNKLANRASDFIRHIQWLDSIALDAWRLMPLEQTKAFLQGHGKGGIRLPEQLYDDPKQLTEWLEHVCGTNVPATVAEEIANSGKVSGGGGWGYFKGWRPGITEIEAWVCIAKTKCLVEKSISNDHKLGQAIIVHLSQLRKRQVSQGDEAQGLSPVPVPWKDENYSELVRTYSTIMAVWAHVEALEAMENRLLPSEGKDEARGFVQKQVRVIVRQAFDKVMCVPSPKRGWQEDVFLGLTAQALHVIAMAKSNHALDGFEHPDWDALADLQKDFIRELSKAKPPLRSYGIKENQRIHDADRYLLPVNMAVEGSTFLWSPWCLLALGDLKAQDNAQLSPSERKEAARLFGILADRLPEMRRFAERQYNYVSAEMLYCIGKALPYVCELDKDNQRK